MFCSGGSAVTVAGDYITSVGSVGAAKGEQGLKIRILFTAALLFAVGTANAAPISAGEHEYEFSGWSGPELDVRLFVPEQLDATTPVVIVMHGWSR
jgi:acetyl esterase/lipase